MKVETIGQDWFYIDEIYCGGLNALIPVMEIDGIILGKKYVLNSGGWDKDNKSYSGTGTGADHKVNWPFK